MIDLPVGIDHCLLAGFAGLGIAMLHPDNAIKAFLMDMLEDVVIVDLARRRLVPAGIVAALEIADLIPAGIDSCENSFPFFDDRSLARLSLLPNEPCDCQDFTKLPATRSSYMIRVTGG